MALYVGCDVAVGVPPPPLDFFFLLPFLPLPDETPLESVLDGGEGFNVADDDVVPPVWGGI